MVAHSSLGNNAINGRLLQQPETPEARVAFAADHKVVMYGDPERLAGLADLLGHLDVVARRLGIARRMVVDQPRRMR